MKRIFILLIGIAIGAFAVMLAPGLSGKAVSSWPFASWLRSQPASEASSGEAQESHEQDEHAHEREGRVPVSDAQMNAADIVLAEVRGGELQHHFLVPGTIISDADRVARVSVRTIGSVAELRKGLGDAVDKDEIVAVIESREVADAKSEFLAARVTNDLQQTLAARLKTLWETRATSENDYLRARLSAQDAQIKLDAARQKLFALGLGDAEIAALPQQPVETLRKQALRSPIKGLVAERRVDLGALVGREGQESELFIIVNLDQVWVDLAVSPTDLAKVRDGAEITISAGPTGPHAKAKLVFVSPLLDKEPAMRGSSRPCQTLPTHGARGHSSRRKSRSAGCRENPCSEGCRANHQR